MQGFNRATDPASGSNAREIMFWSLYRAVDRLVATPDGLPGVIVVLRGAASTIVTAGVADLATKCTNTSGDEMRLASVPQARRWRGSALAGRFGSPLSQRHRWNVDTEHSTSLVAHHTRGLLNYIGRIPDFSERKAFRAALKAKVKNPPPPADS